MGGLVFGGVLAVVPSCGPEIVESHRDKAEKYCRDYTEKRERCGTPDVPWPDDLRQRERDKCEEDEAWDWTDECGDLYWEKRQCRLNVSCEDWPAASMPDDTFCEEEDNAFYRKCRYGDDHKE
jgi:hypothetical protein